MGVAQGEDGAVAARRARQGAVARRERRFLLAVNDAGGSSARRERDAPVVRAFSHRRARPRGDRRPPPRTRSERRVETRRDARRRDGARLSRARASSDPPDENVEDGSGTTFADRSATVATEDALRRSTARDLNVLADTQSAPQTRVRASRHLREVLETRVEPALLAATAAELFLKPFLRRLEDERAVSRKRRGRARRAGARHRGVPRGGRARRRAGPAPVRRAGAARQARARRRSASLGVRRSRRGTERLRLRLSRANGPARTERGDPREAAPRVPRASRERQSELGQQPRRVRLRRRARAAVHRRGRVLGGCARGVRLAGGSATSWAAVCRRWRRSWRGRSRPT